MMDLVEALTLVKNRQQQQEFLMMRSYIASEYPNTVRALRLIELDYTEPRRRKGYNLIKRENKRHGFLYYVRYSHKGKMLPTKWNTRTNILEEAERFARGNRDRLVEEYLRKHDTVVYDLLEKFYAADSPYLVSEGNRNRALSDRRRDEYHAVIMRKFIPFLKEQRISSFDKITVHKLSDFQDWLLAGKYKIPGEKGAGEKIRPQTVNDNLKAVRRLFIYLVRKGIVSENPCRNLDSIPVRQADRDIRGCYELEKLKGVFDKAWKKKESYLLCLLIYTSGIRNSEIMQIKKSDIISMNGCHFIDIKQSKTSNGIRLVPLHDFVYRKLGAYVREKAPEALIFEFVNVHSFVEANKELAQRLHMTDTEMRAEHISFYSGRHFWKTLMNSEGLGDEVEELFMGHRVSGDVSKLYNHKDKQGKGRIIAKAKKVFAILDKKVFL
jgi:integrase